MIHQSMQLRFFLSSISISHLSSFAARPCNFVRIGTLDSLKGSLMGKRRFSNSSKSTSSVFEDEKDEKDKKSNKSAETSPNSESNVIKENDLRIESVEIQSIKDDPTKIETMTVQELRKTLKAVGVPARGCKGDLVSALKCFVDKQFDGQSFQEEAHFTESVLMQKKGKNAAEEDSVQTVKCNSEASGLKQRKKRMKQSPAENNSAKVNVEKTTEKRLLIRTDEISVTLPQAEPWAVLAHKKPQKGWIPYNPRTMRPPPLTADTKSVKLMSWNVNGLRALLKLEGFSALELAQRENFDVLCLQETKLQEKDVESIKQCLIQGYENSFWTCSHSKLGYSGTAIVSRIKPLSVRYGLGIPEHDSEGRVVTAEFDSFYLISTYVPNSGDGLKRLSYRIMQWDPSLSNYMKELEKSKPVILTGDLNCAYQEIDVHDPAGNRRSAGFTDEERQSFGANFLSKGFVDTFRTQHPNVVGYTYWGYRHGLRKVNKGWRLDYFLVSESVADNVHDSYIVPDVVGSDHCPIGLILKL